MSLSIGQVSKLLNISVETLRYYEDEKIVIPQRNKANLYREYSIWDIFDLTDCIKYRNMDFSINETRKMMRTNDLPYIQKQIDLRISGLEQNITDQQILLARMKEYQEQIRNAPLNIGNFWFKSNPERKCIPCTTRTAQEYTEYDYNDPVIVKWVNKIPFVKIFMYVPLESYRNHLDSNVWYYTLDSKYFDIIRLPMNDQLLVLPSQIYLHTIIDIGGKKELSINQLDPVVRYVEKKGMSINGDIIGELLVRYYEEHKWHRLVEIMVPVKR